MVQTDRFQRLAFITESPPTLNLLFLDPNLFICPTSEVQVAGPALRT